MTWTRQQRHKSQARKGKRCAQCGRCGIKGFRTVGGFDHPRLGPIPPITVCANSSACRKRWP